MQPRQPLPGVHRNNQQARQSTTPGPCTRARTLLERPRATGASSLLPIMSYIGLPEQSPPTSILHPRCHRAASGKTTVIPTQATTSLCSNLSRQITSMGLTGFRDIVVYTPPPKKKQYIWVYSECSDIISQKL